MQAHSFFLGGLPMLFYGDEAGYTNDYSYLEDEGKSYDNRWMHRPIIDWEKNKKITMPGTVEERVYSGTRKLLSIRKSIRVIADHSNLTWLTPHNIHVAGYMRAFGDNKFFGIFNFGSEESFLTWYAFKEQSITKTRMYDHWKEREITIGNNDEYLVIAPYDFLLLEAM